MESILNKYEISLKTGYLLPNPLCKLPELYAPWQYVTENMIEFVKAGSVRSKIAKMPQINVESLQTEGELRLALLQLCTLMAGYVWSEGENNLPKILPKQIAIPLMQVCEILNVEPCTSHMTVCLANYHQVDSNQAISAENMRTISFKFIEDFGNEWFFLNAAQVELDFAPALGPIILGIFECQKEKPDVDIVADCLNSISNCIRKMTASFLTIDKHLKPEVFFHGFRPYLSGFSAGKYEKWGGIIFEGYESLGPQKLSGGSAAQTSTFQALDAFLGVLHHKESLQFLRQQRHYMPENHRNFLKWIDRESKIRNVVLDNISNSRLLQAYNHSLDALVDFRNNHIRVVTRYILTQRNGKVDYQFLNDTGTGGTGFMKFLKDVRDVTKKHKIDC